MGRWGLGPAFWYEWLMTSRRWQLYAGRALVIAFLLAALGIVWWSQDAGRRLPNLRASAAVGESFFCAIIGTQLTLVLLAAPAFAAGAICMDKSRGVLIHLLVTDLSSAEIILGKLAARLMAVLGLVLASLPVMTMATWMGGIEPEALLGAYLVLVGVALLGCSFALTLSVWGKKTHKMLLVTYLVWSVWLLAESIAAIWTPRGTVPWLAGINPYWLAFGDYARPGLLDWTDCLLFLGGSLAVSAALILLAVSQVRRVTVAQAGQSAGARGAIVRLFDALLDFLQNEFGARAHGLLSTYAWERLTPSLDDNPVLWREWHRRRLTGWVRIVWWIYILGAVFFTLVAMVQIIGFWRVDREMPALVNGFLVAIGLLLVSVTAVTALAEERSRGSLDVLLTTPMSTLSIVWGKWWGAYRQVPRLAILPGVTACLLVLQRGAIGHLLLIVVLTLTYGAAVASLGLALATWISRFGRAVTVSVTCYVSITAGWVFVLLALFGKSEISMYLAMASPFYGIGLLTVEMDHSWDKETIWWGIAWVVIYAAVAVALFRATWMSFDRCLGRTADRDQPQPGPTGVRKAVARAPGREDESFVS